MTKAQVIFWDGLIQQNKKNTKNKFKKGQVLFGKLRPYLQKYWLAEYDGVCSSEVWVLNSKNKKCSNEFLFRLVQSSRFIQVANVSSGSKMPRADWDYVSTFPFTLPSLPEQKVIAHILSLMDTAINKNKQLIAKKELQKKWLMQNLLTGKRRLKGFKRNLEYHKTEFGLKIPKDWKIVTVNDIFDERNEKSNDQSKYPLFSLTIEKGLTEKTDRYERSFLLKDQENNQYKIVRFNDILFNPMNLRFGAIAKSEKQFQVLVSGYYNVITKSSESINIDYFIKLFQTVVYHIFYERIAIGSLIEKKRVHLSNFFKLQVPLPTLQEQTAIAQVLQAADKEIQLLKDKSEKLREQKKGLMQVLLTGKKRLNIN